MCENRRAMEGGTAMTTHSHYLIRQFRARPRLFFSFLAGALIFFLLPRAIASALTTRLIVCWNVAVCLYIAWGGATMMRATHEEIRNRAKVRDEGSWVILILVMLASIASLVAIVLELAAAKDMTGGAKVVHVALAAFTIFSSWTFVHMMFALHYAHDYYVACAREHTRGLEFPGEEMPDYGDFLYFSFIIGTSAQTADVSFTSTSMRRIGLLHCVLSFFFNTTVLALTINIAASLF
jgi:uncharacterized membrane protein